jgi:hypothetical protein
MMQSNAFQVATVAKNSGYKGNMSQIFDNSLVIFDSRLMGLHWAAQQTHAFEPPFRSPLVPVPLIPKYNMTKEHAAQEKWMGEHKISGQIPGVFWSGSCHADLRERLAPILRSSHDYDFEHVADCRATKLKLGTFVQNILMHTWSLAPRGSYPTAFALAETVMLNRLPIYISDFSMGDEPGWEGHDYRILNQTSMFKYFPYADVVNWEMVAVAIDQTQLPKLGMILKSKTNSTTQMLAYVKTISHMFGVDGLRNYMLNWMKTHDPSTFC